MRAPDRRLVLLALMLLVGRPSLAAGDPDYDAAAASARRILGELVAADTSNPPGNEARAVAVGAARLKAAGIPFERLEFAPGRENLVARIAGDGSARPILFVSHVDVVGTAGQAWSVEPHRLSERDGYFYGRGVVDDLGRAAVQLEAFILLAKSGVRLRRDVILAWTGDEESGGAGVRWLLKHRRERVDAEFAFNEGGGVILGTDGRPLFVAVNAAEKGYQDFTLTARGTTGHSSVPLADNAILRLSRGLERLSRHRFAPRMLPVTRGYFMMRAASEAPHLAAAMRVAAQTPGPIPKDALAVLERDSLISTFLRTTCVPTLLTGGTRVNALPAEATATVNCRLLPGDTVEKVRAALVEALDDPGLEVKAVDDEGIGPVAAPVEGEGMEAVRKVAARLYPGVPVAPSMSLGASDSRFLRAAGIAAYGLDLPRSEEDNRRAHGVDERLPVPSLRSGVELMHRLAIELAGKR